MFQNLSIRYKNLILVGASLIGVLTVSAIGLSELRSNMLADRQQQVRSVVEVVHGVLGDFAVKVGTGELNFGEAQRQAASAVGSLRFGDGEYFWINDMTPRMVVHPYRYDLNGKDVSDLKDPAGKRLVVEMVETVRRDGEGFVSYLWPKPGSAQPVEKISYVKGFRPWGWVVGSGIYVDDVNTIFWRQAEILGVSALAILLVVAGISWWISRNITRPLASITTNMSQLSNGDTSVPIAFTGRTDEVGDLARAMNVFKQNTLEIERLRAEKERLRENERTALRESEERFRDFAEASSDWLWETDVSGCFTFVSGRVADSQGYRPEELVGKSRKQIAEGIGYQEQWAFYDAAIRDRRAFRDFRFDTLNDRGEIHVIRMSGKPRFDQTGKFYGYRGTGTDISAEIMASRREAQTHKRFMSAIETFPIGIALFDSEDRLVVCNERYREANPIGAVLQPGISFEQLIRATVAKGVVSLAKGREEEYVQERLAQHRNPAELFETILSDRWVTIHEYRTEEGDTLLVTLDITDRKRTEEALRASEEKFRGLFEHANDSIFLTDPETGQILEANANTAKHLGYGRDEITSMTIWDFLRSADGEQVPELLDILTSRSRAVIEAEQIHSDGSRIPVEISSRLVQYETKPVIQSIVRDISNRKEMQQQLVDAQKMRAVGELTGGIAHDFNNLLTVIIGSLDWLQEIVREDGRARKLVSSALEAAQRGSHLTRSLLAYARRQTLSPESIDLQETITVIKPLLAQALPESIVIELDIPDGLWPVMADPVQLESAILNLAFNARDAMPGCGRLILQARNGRDGDRSTVDRMGSNGYVHLSFCDNGQGMPPEIVSKACDPFFTTKEVGQGSGLGLSMVKGFVEQSGGTLTIESSKGEGTTVTLSLPRAMMVKGTIPWSADVEQQVRSMFEEESR